MTFDQKYFAKFDFSEAQVNQFLSGALRDLEIAQKDRILEVKFNYSYGALLKSGIALIAVHGRKVRSVPGHHVKIIEKLSEILKDKNVDILGNLMRTKRNLDLYAGTWEITEKECEEYLSFSESVLSRVKRIAYSS
jgi:hypothetical protein